MLLLRSLVKFLWLPAADRNFLIRVVLVVWAVRLMLWLLPFRNVRELLTRFSGAEKARVSPEEVPLERVAWAVTIASRYVPAASCLTQALVTKVLLGRLGHHAIVRIGVARSEQGEFQAHAWVESNGKIVIGGSEASLQRYTPLAAANGELW
jgi:hypothetical protein